MKSLLVLAYSMVATTVLATKDVAPVRVEDFRQLWKNSPIDHYNYQDHRAFKQRYWINDKYFDASDPHAPVFLYICGEYTCSIREDRLYPFMVGAEHGALLLALEHRYYGESQPFEDLSLDSLRYLSAEQALSDIAHFLRLTNAGAPSRPVVVIGGSYPGALSAWFRQRYPQMTVGSWSSSGVVYPVVDFWAFDWQIYASTQKSGDDCPATIQALQSEMTKQLAVNNSQVKTDAGAYPGMHDGDFAFYFADIFVESVQYGNRTGLCKLMSEIANKPFNEQLKAVAAQAKLAGVAPQDYCRNALKNTTITGSPARQWTYQYCTSFGWFQTPSQHNGTSMRSSLLNLTYWYDYCDELFNTSLKFNRSITEFAFNRQSGTYTVFTNGGEDPWQWATERTGDYFLQQESLLADCDDCGHCAELYTPKDSDPDALRYFRDHVAKIVGGWLRHHKEAKAKPGNPLEPPPQLELSTSFLQQ